ncbi:MAG: complex I subunit 5 family protein [Desulfurococcales archaeon]|nr:complex I subunit 5 family protein [Desulfurococcales archaeon]
MVVLDTSLLWLSVLLPVIISILGVRSEKYETLASIIAALLLFPLVIVAVAAIKGSLSSGIVDPAYTTINGIGTLAFALDGLSALVVAGISVVTAFVAFYSLPYMKTRIEEMRTEGEEPPSLGVYYLLYTLFAVAMVGLVYSTNLILFYLFLELTLIPSFLLIAYYGYGDRKRIAMLYFVWTHLGAVVFLAGALYYGYIAGNFDYLNIDTLSPVGNAASILGNMTTLIAALMTFGLFVKMAVLGVHMWLPYAHAEAPTPISALLSPNLIGLAGYAMARITVPLFPDFYTANQWFFIYLAFATIIYGGLVALKQTDFKRFLAYSSVSQMGYMLLGIATLTSLGITGAMLHYLAHAVGKAVLFMTAGVFITDLHGFRDITRMGGLARKYPMTAALALVGFMHLVGMPPTVGMWSEIFIILGLFRAIDISAQFILITLLLIVALGISASYAFINMRRIFYGKPRSDTAERAKPESVGILQWSMLAIAFFGFLFFLWITPYYDSLLTAASKIVQILQTVMG